MATLEGQTIAGSYKDLLQVSNSNSGVDGTLRSIEDGEGTASVLKISSSAVEITDGAYDFDVASHDGTNGLKLGGTLVTSSATELNLLDGITTLSGSNTGDQATGISDGNVLVANAAVADNDFLKIDGTSVEGRTAAEVAADIEGSIDAVGTLASGAISSGFGNIDIGSSTFDTTGAVATGALTLGGDGQFDASAASKKLRFNQDATHALQLGWNYDGTPGDAYGWIKTHSAHNDIKIDGKLLLISTDGGGNVGIGTASPDAPINVESAITTSSFDGDDADCLAIFQNTQDTDNGGGSYIKLDSSRAGENMGIVWNSQDDNDSRFVFVDNRGGNGYQRMAFDNNGKVGIGENDPATLLEMSSAIPYLTLHNTTEENNDGTRESKIIFKGEKSDTTEHTLAEIWVMQQGSGDDFDGLFRISTNTTSGGADDLVAGLQLDSASNVSVMAGNLVIGSAGGGIDFSACTGNGGAEILDDYEEGTWDAVVTDGSTDMTMDRDGGFYTKVGNMVTVSGNINTTSLNGLTSESIKISGLPFTVAGTDAAYSSGGVGEGGSLDIAAGHSVSYYAYTTYLYLNVWDAATGTSGMLASEWTANGSIIFGLTYRAA